MEYLDKTKKIVDDLVKNVKKISKSKDNKEISQLEMTCIKQLQLAHMQFGYVSRDIRSAVVARRAAIRDAALKSTEEAIDKALGKEDAPQKEEQPQEESSKEEQPKNKKDKK